MTVNWIINNKRIINYKSLKQGKQGAKNDYLCQRKRIRRIENGQHHLKHPATQH